jgi:hypothetical protein
VCDFSRIGSNADVSASADDKDVCDNKNNKAHIAKVLFIVGFSDDDAL